MHFRRSAAVAVAAAALLSTGCAELDDRGKPQNVAVAVFDPTRSQIPLPNDLALASIPNAAVAAGCVPGPTVPDARTQFLCRLKASGGFPNDQEVSVSFAFQRQSVDGAGALHVEPAVLDTTTIRVRSGTVAAGQATVAVFDVTDAPTTAPTSVPVEASYDAASGTLRLRKALAADGSRRWIGGHRYVVFVRGGASGVKTVGGGQVEPMPTMFVLREAIISDRDLTVPDNQTLIPGTAEEKAAAGARLEQIRQGYRSLAPIFSSLAFGGAPFSEMVNMLTFTVAPYPGVVVEVDSTKGSAPLPIDLLRAPDAAGGLILDSAAYGAARSGMVTLDGFSTTAPITAPVTGSVATLDAATIGTASGNVLVYDLSTTPPTLLKEFNQELQTGGPTAARAASFIAQPPGTFIPPGTGLCPRTNLAGAPIGGCASSIVLQPAVPIAAVGAYLPPLKGATKYAVVLTKRVRDILGQPLARSTAAKIILDLTYPVDASIGVDAGTAALLQQVRTDLAPLWEAGVLPSGTTRNDVAMAYVFRTQTVPAVSLQLSAAPYAIEAAAGGAAVFAPQAVTTVTGSYPQVAAGAEVYEVRFTSVDATSKVNGALDPAALASAASHLTTLKALVAVPDPTLVPTSCPAPASALKCAPLVVFGHGLRGHKGNLLVRPDGTPASVDPTVNSLLARGFVVAAIDFPQHGERTWCLASSDCDLGAPGSGGGTCTKFTTPAGAPSLMGDVDANGVPTAPGVCTAGTPNPARSGQTFISSNFFRIRDAFRQNLLDQSALVLALARPTPTIDAFTTRLAAHGVAVDPSKVYWEGISLGGIAGTEVLATNPRFSRGVTSVAGGTLVDVFTKAPAFQAQVNALFTSLLRPQLDTIAPGQAFDPAFVDPSNASSFAPVVAAQYGKTLLLAKWILDPGDALNYAKHLRTAPLPNLLANPGGTVLQSPKAVLGQVAVGDLVIPNDLNRQLFRNGAIDVVEYTSNAYPAAQMHGVLSFDATVQDQAAAYLADPVANLPPAPPTQVTIP